MVGTIDHLKSIVPVSVFCLHFHKPNFISTYIRCKIKKTQKLCDSGFPTYSIFQSLNRPIFKAQDWDPIIVIKLYALGNPKMLMIQKYGRY